MDFYKKFQVKSKNNTINQKLSSLESLGFNVANIKSELQSINKTIDYSNDSLSNDRFETQMMILDELNKFVSDLVSDFEIVNTIKKVDSVKQTKTKVIMLLESLKKYMELSKYGYIESHSEIYETIYSVIKEEYNKSNESILYNNLYLMNFGFEEVNKELFKDLESHKEDSDIQQILDVFDKKKVYNNKAINEKLLEMILFVENGKKEELDNKIKELQKEINKFNLDERKLNIAKSKLEESRKKFLKNALKPALSLALTAGLYTGSFIKVNNHYDKEINNIPTETYRENMERDINSERIAVHLIIIFLVEVVCFVLSFITLEVFDIFSPIGFFTFIGNLSIKYCDDLKYYYDLLKNDKKSLKELKEVLNLDKARVKELELFKLRLENYNKIKEEYFAIKGSDIKEEEKEDIEKFDKLVNITSDLVEVLTDENYFENKNNKSKKITSSDDMETKKETLSNLLKIDEERIIRNEAKIESTIIQTINLIKEINNNYDKLDNESKSKILNKIYIPMDMLIKEVDNHKEFNPMFIPYLKYINLCLVKSDNLKVSNIDFRDTNIDIDPQKVYQKDLSGIKLDSRNISPFRDFDGCNIVGASFEDNAYFDDDLDYLSSGNTFLKTSSRSK